MTAEHDAVVYDLDGTLVRLPVDWSAAHRDALAAAREAGVTTAGESLWELLDRAEREGFAPVVEAVVADHERRAAREAELLDVAAELPRSVPVGVCSLNAEAACRLALHRHGLDTHVDVIVGRDSVEESKPHPEPLLAAVRGLSATPDRTLFVGDSDRDALAAERAGVEFRPVGAGEGR